MVGQFGILLDRHRWKYDGALRMRQHNANLCISDVLLGRQRSVDRCLAGLACGDVAAVMCMRCMAHRDSPRASRSRVRHYLVHIMSPGRAGSRVGGLVYVAVKDN